MIPGEIFTADGVLTLNEGRETIDLVVANTGDRPVQVGSHYHFFETNEALDFDREAAKGYRLDIPVKCGQQERYLPAAKRVQQLFDFPQPLRFVHVPALVRRRR